MTADMQSVNDLVNKYVHTYKRIGPENPNKPV